MYKALLSRSAPRATVSIPKHAIKPLTYPLYISRRGYATAEEKDLVIIGGGVAGYVAAIKAGQEGLSVRATPKLEWLHMLTSTGRMR
jgi:dihydrolipoamide dehydrogenase